MSAPRHALDAREAFAGRQRGTLVVVVVDDVREARDRLEARVPDARHPPLSHLGEGLESLSLEAPLAFLCRTGRRSAVAAVNARYAGFDACIVRGGLIAWQAAGLPLRRGEDATS